MSTSFSIPTDLDLTPPAEIGGLKRKAWIAAAIGLIASGVGLMLEPTQFYRSWLVAWLFWLGVALGCFALGLLHQLTRGEWGLMIRRLLGAATRTLPLLLLLFVPIVVGMKEIYVWAQPEVVAHDALVQHKAWYLNPRDWIIRGVGYFAIWIFFARVLNHLSKKQDVLSSGKIFRRMQAFAAPGLLLYVLTATFASVDWLMSLDPHWYSSLFGISFVGGHAVSALAFLVPMALWIGRYEPMSRLLRPRHFHDYGKLMLAFVMLWTYFQLSQLIIIWSGNLPEEVTWYLARTAGAWKWITIGLVLFHFALPFLLLLSRDVKRDARKLAIVALVLLAMRWVDLYWQAAPAFTHGAKGGLHLHWLDLATLVAVGGVWMAFFLSELAKRPLLPVYEPFLGEALRE